VTVAGYTAGQRANQVPRGKYIAFVSILVGTAITMILLLMLKVFPFTPRYIIPAAGLMVGNAMTVTGIAMKKLQEDVTIQKNQVSYKPSRYLETCDAPLNFLFLGSIFSLQHYKMTIFLSMCDTRVLLVEVGN
jgi:putative ABC transport system permease protein